MSARRFACTRVAPTFYLSLFQFCDSLQPLLSSQSGDDDDDDDDDEDDDNDDGGERTTGTVSGAGGQTATMEPEGAAVGVGGEKTKAPTGGVPGS